MVQALWFHFPFTLPAYRDKPEDHRSRELSIKAGKPCYSTPIKKTRASNTNQCAQGTTSCFCFVPFLFFLQYGVDIKLWLPSNSPHQSPKCWDYSIRYNDWLWGEKGQFNISQGMENIRQAKKIIQQLQCRNALKQAQIPTCALN